MWGAWIFNSHNVIPYFSISKDEPTTLNGSTFQSNLAQQYTPSRIEQVRSKFAVLRWNYIVLSSIYLV
jgi:hypothetical protein